MDLDGVDDKNDQCPNTSLTELVDMTGCTIKNLVSNQHFDIILGGSRDKYAGSTTKSTTLRADYYRDDYSLSLSTSNTSNASRNSKQDEQYDTYLNLYHEIKSNNHLSVKLNGGLIIPSHGNDDNKLDVVFGASAGYVYDSGMGLFGYLGYTIIGDKDKKHLIEYQNTLYANFGLGKQVNSKLYTSLSYSISNSIYDGYENLRSVMLNASYSVDEHWFLALGYSHGLSDSAVDESTYINIGYYW